MSQLRRSSRLNVGWSVDSHPEPGSLWKRKKKRSAIVEVRKVSADGTVMFRTKGDRPKGYGLPLADFWERFEFVEELENDMR